MNKVEYSPDILGIIPENVFLEDCVMVSRMNYKPEILTVPVIESSSGRVVRTEKKQCLWMEQLGAQSLGTDLLLSGELRSGVNCEIEPFNGGYKIKFPTGYYVVRPRKEKEFSSIHSYMTKDETKVYNNIFIQKMFYSDFLLTNPLSQWRMPFSPESMSSFAVSWQMIDANGGKWECVSPALQKPAYTPRLKHFAILDASASSVGIVQANAPGYDVGSHSFQVTPGCKIRLVFINSPLGAKEWESWSELDLDSGEIKFKL
jgi:hypothetical protein